MTGFTKAVLTLMSGLCLAERRARADAFGFGHSRPGRSCDFGVADRLHAFIPVVN